MMKLRCEPVASDQIKIVSYDNRTRWNIYVDGNLVCSCSGALAASCAALVAKGIEEGSMPPSCSVERFQKD